MDRLIVMRHAESVFNERGVLNGDPSVPGGLTERGKQQAWRAHALLAAEPLDLCITTEFQRCIETADIVLEGRNAPHVIWTELSDPPVGELELRPYADLEAWRAQHGPDRFVPGISTSEYFGTIRRGFSLVAQRPEAHILAVIHGEGLRWVLTALGEETMPGQGEPVFIASADLGRALRTTLLE